MGFAKHAGRVLVKRGLPVHLIFQATYRCNSRCRNCFLWKELGDSTKELSTEEIDRFSKKMGDLLWLIIGGGEPFMRDDLAEICRIFRRNNHVDSLSIPTNGLLTDRIYSTVNDILTTCDIPTFLLTLSIDGVGASHDKLRGVKGNFRKVMETFEKVSALRKDHPNFVISANTVISNENESEIEDVIRFVREEMDVDSHSFEFVRGDCREKSVSLPGPERCRELTELVKSTIESYHYRSGIRGAVLKRLKLKEHDIIQRTMEENRRVIPCFAGDINAVIDPFGNVSFCEILPSGIGSLRQAGYDFRKLWFSPEADEVRKKVKGCYCTHGCFNLTNVMFNPTAYF